MKFSVISSLIIVGITVVIATLQGQRLGDLSDENKSLEEKAYELGVPIDGSQVAKSTASNGEAVAGKGEQGNNAGTVVVSPEMESDAQAFTDELIAFAVKMREWQKNGGEPPASAKKEMFAFMGRFLELDPNLLPIVIAQIRSTTDLDEEEKRGIVGFSFMMLSQNAPEAALNLYINSKDMVEDERMAQHMVGLALASWAGKEPAAAMAWLDQHRDTLPAQAADGARMLAIGHTFKTEPRLAMRMSLKLEREQLLEMAGGLHKIIVKPDEQLSMLRSIQGQLGDLPSVINDEVIENASNEQVLRGGILMGIGQAIAGDSFERANEFLDSANLSPIETNIVALGVSEAANDLKDHASWLTWIDSNAAPEQREKATTEIVEQWTNDDFRSTAAWIGTQPQGHLRDRATYTFAQTVAPHEPDQAANWALALPASEERTVLLQNIHTHWQGKDPAAAQVFAVAQGLQTNTAPEVANPNVREQ